MKKENQKFTKAELKEIYRAIATNLDWGVGGCYGDGENFYKGKIKIAERICNKIELFLKEQ